MYRANRNRRFTPRRSVISQAAPSAETRKISIIQGSLNDPAYLVVNQNDESLQKSKDYSSDSIDEDDLNKSDKNLSMLSDSLWQGSPSVQADAAAKLNRKASGTSSVSSFQRFLGRAKIGAINNSIAQQGEQPKMSRRSGNLEIQSPLHTHKQLPPSRHFSNMSCAQANRFQALSPVKHERSPVKNVGVADHQNVFSLKAWQILTPVSAVEEGDALEEESQIGESCNLSAEENSSHEKHKHSTESSEVHSWTTCLNQAIGQLHKRFTISPQTAMFQVWKVMDIILSFASSFYYAHTAAFYANYTPAQVTNFEAIDLALTLYFSLDLALNIITNEHTGPDEWTIATGLRRVLGGRFCIDLLALLPFPRLFGPAIKSGHYFYLVRIVRIYNGYTLLDYRTYKNQLLEMQRERMRGLIKTKETGEDQTHDNAKLSQIVLAIQVLKTFRSVINMGCLSYFIGIIWLLVCEAEEDLFPARDAESFISQYDLRSKVASHVEIAMTYFSFTTITTVGFGDYHPKTDLERILCAVIMLFGVMVASMAMDNFSTMVHELKSFNKPYDDSERLALFLGTIKHLNGQTPLSRSQVQSLHRYLEYRWQHDRNLAISTEEDRDLLDQLPGRIQTQIYVSYLFKNFVSQFKDMLNLGQERYFLRRGNAVCEKDNVIIPYDGQLNLLDSTKFFSNYIFDSFIVEFLSLLEPISTSDQQVLLRQDAEVNEMYFMQLGGIEVGYNSSKFLLESKFEDLLPADLHTKKEAILLKKKMTASLFISRQLTARGKSKKNNRGRQSNFIYPLKRPAGQPIGIFEILFSLPASYSYRVDLSLETASQQDLNRCYFIRRNHFNQMVLDLKEDPDFGKLMDKLKDNILVNYAKKIHGPMQRLKREHFKQQLGGLLQQIEDPLLFEEKREEFVHLIQKQSLKSSISKHTGPRKSGTVSDASMFTDLRARPVDENDIELEVDASKFGTREDIAESMSRGEHLDLKEVLRSIHLMNLMSEEESKDDSSVEAEVRCSFDDLQEEISKIIERQTSLIEVIIDLRSENNNLRIENLGLSELKTQSAEDLEERQEELQSTRDKLAHFEEKANRLQNIILQGGQQHPMIESKGEPLALSKKNESLMMNCISQEVDARPQKRSFVLKVGSSGSDMAPRVLQTSEFFSVDQAGLERESQFSKKITGRRKIEEQKSRSRQSSSPSRESSQFARSPHRSLDDESSSGERDDQDQIRANPFSLKRLRPEMTLENLPLKPSFESDTKSSKVPSRISDYESQDPSSRSKRRAPPSVSSKFAPSSKKGFASHGDQESGAIGFKGKENPKLSKSKADPSNQRQGHGRSNRPIQILSSRSSTSRESASSDEDELSEKQEVKQPKAGLFQPDFEQVTLPDTYLIKSHTFKIQEGESEIHADNYNNYIHQINADPSPMTPSDQLPAQNRRPEQPLNSFEFQGSQGLQEEPPSSSRIKSNLRGRKLQKCLGPGHHSSVRSIRSTTKFKPRQIGSLSEKTISEHIENPSTPVEVPTQSQIDEEISALDSLEEQRR